MVEGYIRQLMSYFKKNLTKGYTLESLKWALINQGYDRAEIDRAIKLVNEELAKSAPLLKEKPVIKLEREPLLDEIEKPAGRIKSFFKSLLDVFRS
ncbi:MAG: hypothetical protein AABX71_01905 [Nanoarchaeota archaeon]